MGTARQEFVPQSSRRTARETERQDATARRLHVVQKMLDSEKKLRVQYEHTLQSERDARKRYVSPMNKYNLTS